MGVLRALFGPSQEEIWHQLCQEIGADYLEGGFWRGDKVQARVKDWIITLDTYTVSTGKSSVTYTRLRAPFVNQDGFRFLLYRQGFFSELGKSLGWVEDIEVGYPEFDQGFILQGNDPAKVRALFANPRIRQLIQLQPTIYLAVKDDEGWFGAHFPEGVDELYFQVVGVIKEVERLKALFELFAETLNQLGHLDSAYEDDALLFIQALQSPGGQIQDGPAVLWDGDTLRRQAAEGLGRLRDPRGVEPLLQALSDPDAILQMKAIDALGEIGDERAVSALIPFLGEEGETDFGGELGRTEGGRFCDHAARALRRLGQGGLTEAFSQILEGNQEALETLTGEHRAAVVQGLIRALDSPSVRRAVHAAGALAALGAVEALPALRSKAQRRRFAEEQARSLWARAVAHLEILAALPRPAEAEATDIGTLPRPALGTEGGL
jgi:HEAT repeat protein